MDDTQAGFVQVRLISPHIGIAQELVRDLSRKVPGVNVIVKLDMAKAYDRLEWHFLLRALEVFGVSPVLSDLIYRNIADIWYQFRINRDVTGNVRSYRGVCQGDHLFPLLFILAQQVISFNIQKQIQESPISSYKVGRNAIALSHLFYADDVLIFTNGTENSLKNVMQLLQEYERSSAELVNQGKSRFYIHDKYQRRVPVIERATRLTRLLLSLIYLGVLIFYGRAKAIYFEHMVEKVRKALEGWKAKLLSFGGRITLIKSILTSYPIYTLASSRVPKSILQRIEWLMAPFLWGLKEKHGGIG